MNVLSLLGAILPGFTKIIDDAVADKDLAAKLKADLTHQVLTNEATFADAASKVVTTEAQGESWLQRNWRPILMLWFGVLISAFWFGFVPVNMNENWIGTLFELMKIGIGGYVVGRSGEKIAKAVAPALYEK